MRVKIMSNQMLDYMFVAASQQNQYVVNAKVRGYLIYQEVWEVRVGEILSRVAKGGWHPHVFAVPSTWFYGNI